MSSFPSPHLGGAVSVERFSHRRATQNGLPLTLSGGFPVLPMPSRRSALRDAAKRVMDVSGALLGLIALAPALVVLAGAIKLSSPGPVLFKQWRNGRNGVPFQIYKFRTIRQDATDEAGLIQVTADDPRVTRLGAIMRAKSLDELPQLFNVLKGDMSLVGPRPHAIGMLVAGTRYEQVVPYYDVRHTVRPGLSGWAQVNGLRGPTLHAHSARARVDHDIAYIQNQSLGLDLKIIALTIKNEFLTGSGL